MSRIDAHFTLRLPVDLKADVEASAKTNGRSLNAEIVHRLGGTVMPDDKMPVANIAPFGLRMQPDLKARVEAAAERNGRSLNAEICHRLEASEGRTLRDWFAGQVLTSAAALPNGLHDCEYRAKSAYAMADAMLAAREVKP